MVVSIRHVVLDGCFTYSIRRELSKLMCTLYMLNHGLQELQRVMSRCLDFLYSGTDTSSGLQTHTDYMLVIKTFEAQVDGWRDQWIRPWQGPNDQRVANKEQSVAEYKQLIARFYYHYAILVLNAFGLQTAMDRSPVDLGHFFARCHSSATACALLVRDGLGPNGFLKYSPDSHFVLTSYAVLSLLKVSGPPPPTDPSDLTMVSAHVAAYPARI